MDALPVQTQVPFDREFSQLYHQYQMGQYSRLFCALSFTLALVAAMLVGGCDRANDGAASAPPTASPAKPTVASLVPSMTDVLLQMGVREQLVGISNYDPTTPDRAGLPRVGDYHSVDWEQLTAIRPTVLVIPTPKQEVAAVFEQRASSLGIKLVDIHVDRVVDLYPAILRLGDAVGAPAAATDLVKTMESELKAVQARVENSPRVRTLIATDETGQFIVGPRNFLDDLLTMAGGINVAADFPKDYPKIDKEKLLELDPEAVIQLMPDAPPQVLDAAKRFWAGLPQLQAVRNGRVYFHSEPYLLLPGPSIIKVAEKMADDLHPLTSTDAATTTVR